MMRGGYEEHVADFFLSENTSSRLIKAGFVRQVNKSLILILCGYTQECFEGLLRILPSFASRSACAGKT